MRDLLNQDRALSPSVIRMAINIVGALFVVSLLLILVVEVFGWFWKSAFFSGLLQFTLAAGFLLTLYMIVRLQAEAVMAAHRNTDRLAILTEALNAQQGAPATTEQAAIKPKTSSAKTKSKKKSAAANTASED